MTINRWAEEHSEILGRIFPSLDPSGLRSLMDLALVTHYEPGGLVAHEGAYASGVHVVESGILCTGRHAGTSGATCRLRLLGPGRAFGIETLFLNGRCVYSEFAKAIEQSKVLFLERESLLDCAKDHPLLFHDLCRVMAPEIRWLEFKLVRRGSEPVERRLCALLIALARLTGAPHADGLLLNTTMSRQMMAEYLGISIASLLRHLKPLRERGLIETGEQGRLVVRDLHALVKKARLNLCDIELLEERF